MQSRGANTPVVVERINEEAHTQLWIPLPVDEDTYVLQNSATGGYASVENGKVIERDALFLQVRNLHWKLEKSVLDVTGMSSTHTQKRYDAC